MVTVKQFRTISLVVLLLAVILAIASLSVVRFAELSAPAAPVTKIGAFHGCVDLGGGTPIGGLLEFCGSIDRNCTLNTNLPFLGSLPVGTVVNDCDKFNLFRGMHVSGTLFICLAFVFGAIYLCTNPLASPKYALGMDITYCFFGVAASAFYVVSLVTANQVFSDTADWYSSRTSKFSADKGASFYLTGAADAFTAIAVFVWLCGRCGTKPSTGTGVEGMPLMNSNGSYVPPTIGGQQQQYFNYGAPPPQPNYQQYGGQQQQYGGAPTAGYGYGYQQQQQKQQPEQQQQQPPPQYGEAQNDNTSVTSYGY